ncbi:rhodanese-like domain-containing protein [Clostridium folliculivorans]|uniref:Sulfurtransferase n=1 Tax=Clostridium folliculivorans TaxID=2886038 RepID=A0A9W5XZZ7_9CLOT|nr:rhodanese-like domain-containing protein [Clostridium folliculivorans]GKU24103.1 sulfurtransferase [Clostridium folliculivorans]GKU30209.1 sulfurtransferase [Clostridium folliculivorans]
MFGFLFKNSIKSVKANEIGELLGKINLIDVREPYEYKNGHLPSAKNIPVNKIIADADKLLDKSKEYHIICQSGARSSRVCSALNKNGFKVINVSGGTSGYTGSLKR